MISQAKGFFKELFRVLDYFLQEVFGVQELFETHLSEAQV
jgi:hypothetical protein